MEHVYYTLVGILAMAGICLVIVALYKAVMFLGDTIDDWWTDRKGRKKHRIESERSILELDAKSGTGRMIVKEGFTHTILPPNAFRRAHGYPEFHKHDYRLKRATATHYGFMCDGHTWSWGQKVACEHWRDISKKDFWKGEKTE